MTIDDAMKRIEELEQRIRLLESRPIYYPVPTPYPYPYPYVQPVIPYGPTYVGGQTCGPVTITWANC